MIFVDTSAIYALLDRADENHARASGKWSELLDANSQLFTTNYVLVESCALAQHRLGLEAVRAIQEDFLPAIEIRWIDGKTHAESMTALLAARRRKLSLVDCSSFAVMRQAGVRVAWAFDKHFAEEGFAFPS